MDGLEKIAIPTAELDGATHDRAQRLGPLPNRNRFLVALPVKDFSLLAPYLRSVRLERGVILHDAGQKIEQVYFPQSGMVSLVTVVQSGGEVETATVSRTGIVGGMVGLGSRCAFGRAVVQIAGDALRLEGSQFHAVAKESDAIRALLIEYNDLLLSQINQSVACNALHAVEARLCRWLLQAQDCLEDDVVPLTQDFLAQMLGVRRTSVTVVARRLQSAGMIRYRRGLISIVDRATLEENACECYGVVKRRIEQTFPDCVTNSNQGAS